MSSIFSKLINLAGNVIGTLKVANGGTGLASGTSGGIPGYTGNTTIASSAALAAGGVVYGGGAGVVPAATAQGTTSQVLIGGTTPSFGNVPTAALPAIGQTTAGVDSSARARLGSNTNDSAASGNIGELLSANPNSGVNPGASTAWVTITSVSLTAGDWDVEGTTYLTVSTLTSTTRVISSVSLTNNGSDSAASGGYNSCAVSAATLVAATASTAYPTGRRRFSFSTTTTVYLTGNIDYLADTGTQWSTNSFIQARRVR